MADSFLKAFLLNQPPHTPGVHPGGRNIAYDLALVKLGPHTKFGEDWFNGVDFYTGHTHTHTNTHRDSTLYIRCNFKHNTYMYIYKYLFCSLLQASS
jgi:hypothetical protein